MIKNLLLAASFVFFLAPNALAQPADAEVSTFASPAVQSFCPTPLQISINIYNNDIIDITEVVLDWSINGIAQSPVTWSGVLAGGTIVAIELDPLYNFVGGTSYDIQVTIQSVNTLTDPNSSNDVNMVTFSPYEVFTPLFYWDGCVLECLNASDYLSIQWYKDGTPDPNAPDNAIYAPTQPGTYTMTALSFDSCTAVADTSIFVSPVSYDITALGGVDFCLGDSVGLVFSASEAVTFTWSTGSTFDTIYATADGWYVVNGLTVNSCPVLDSIHVTVHPLPVITVSQSFDTLYSDFSGTQQWYMDGNVISGATDSTYVTNVTGNYYVVGIDSNGCAGTSNTILVVGILAVDASGGILLYPNPATDILNIRISAITGKLVARICDSVGKIVLSVEMAKDKTIDISALDDGVYHIVFTGNEKMSSQKFVKTH
jgi:hypothetical protein